MLKKFAFKMQLATALLGCIALQSAEARIDYVDRSGTIAAGGVSQTVAPAFAGRTVLIITHATGESEPLCVNVGTAASCSAVGSFQIAPGGQLKLESPETITIVAATTGHKYTAKEVGQGFELSNGGSATITGGGGAGDASAAKQDIGNATLTSIDNKTPALGQALAAASVPIVLTAAQVTTLTPPAAITGFATAAKQPALGTAGSSSTDVISVQGIASGTALPMSAASLPLPTGASTAAKQPALGTAGTPSADVITVQGVTSMTALKVDGSGVTQPVSAASLPLPTGAATAAKQPALGTAGTPASDVITVQGTTSMTALKVDGSAVTQPVSAASLPLPALAATSTKQSDGSQKSQIVDGSGNVIGATSNALDVNIKSGASSGAVAQGSTTSGQTGGLMQAAVTTAAPSYTTAQTSPLSLTTGGGLRIAAPSGAIASGAFASGALASGSVASGAIASGAVASGAYASGALASGSVASGAMVDLGAQADSACGTDTGTCSAIALIKKGNANLTTLAGTNTDLTAVQSPVAPATATATKSNLAGLQYNSTPPTFTNGQQGSLQGDANGYLKVNVAAGSSSGTVSQGSTTSGQSGILNQGAVTTAAPSYTTGQTSPISLTTAGATRVDGSGVTQPVSIATAPVLVAGTAIIGKVGIDQTTPGTTNLVSAAQSGTWTVQPGNTANTTAWKVDGSAVTQPISAASLPLPTNAATGVAQASTTSGQTGTLAQMATSTTPPTHTTAQTNPLSGDLNGFLRVIEPDDKAIASATCTSACAATNLFAVNTVGYNSARVQISAIGVGTLGFQTSEDTTNGTDGTWVTATCASAGSAQATGGVTSAGSVQAWTCPTYQKWLRLNITAYTSGTFTTLGGRLSKTAPAHNAVTLTNSSVSVIGAAGDNAAPVLAPVAVAMQAQSYNTKRSSITSGNVGRPTMDPFGYVNTVTRFSFAHMTTNTTTTHKSGAGLLHTVCVNTKGTGTATVTIYDNTAGSGTVIAVIDSATYLGCMTYDAEFATGLTAVTASTTAADVTFTYN